MRRITLLFAAFTAVSLNNFGQAKLVEKIEKKGNDIVIPYEKYILPNGLTVVLHEDHSDPLVHVDVTYHVGSAREEIGKSGFAHFFEHMMFQGSDHVGDDQHFKIITAAGGTLNGSTNLDRTNYYETVPANQLEKMLWLEADRMGFLLDAVTQQKFEIQRSTVKNERGQNYDNRAYGLAREYSSKNLYPYGHPYSWLTIGYVEDLNRVNVQDLKNFFLRWYGPNNATITIGGDFKSTEVIKLVEKYFGSIPRGPEVTKTILEPVTLTADRYVSYTDNYAKIPQLMLTFPTVPDFHKDMGALECLAQILGQGKTSVLYQQLVKTQKALQASASNNQNELTGEFTFRILPLQGKSLGEMDTLLREALASFEKRGVTDEDIAKFKGSIESQFVNRLQSVSGKVSQLASYQTFRGDANMIGKELEIYRTVTKEDVMRVYNTYIKNKGAVVLSVLTKNNGTPAKADNYTIDSSHYTKPNYGYDGLKYVKATDAFDRSKMPAVGAAPSIKVPAFWKKELPNGIKMIGTEYTELPIATISITIPGGHLAQAKDTSKIGLANMVSNMLSEDTKNYTAEQLSVELQKIGASISVNNSFDGIVFTLNCLTKNIDKAISLLEERMLRPAFTEASFNRLQKQSLENFKQAKSQPATIASNVYRKINYGANSILGWSDNGTENTVKQLTLDDVKDYYNKYMTTQGAKVVVAGNIKQQDVISKLSFLNNIPNKKIELTKVEAKGIPVEKTVIYLVDVPRAAQTEFRIGYSTGMLYDALGEYYRSDLMNFMLGGTFSSHINMNLREDKGWTYGARTGFSGDKYTGAFTFSSGIRADATDSALAEVMKELKLYAENGITPDELSFTKSALTQRDALNYETTGQKAGFISRILDYNLPGNYIDTENKILKDISKSEIDALAKKWLPTNKMNIVLVGDKAKILPGLQKSGFEIVELDTDGNRK
ncbi:MAG: insulinase family protein [Bacteroidetes bacterium]|nr:insulinase family protein [Bacteroidota bacterium]